MVPVPAGVPPLAELYQFRVLVPNALNVTLHGPTQEAPVAVGGEIILIVMKLDFVRVLSP